MTTKLRLKFVRDGSADNSPRAWIILGDHEIHKGERLLSTDCATASEVEGAALILKKELDEIVSSAKRRFVK